MTPLAFTSAALLASYNHPLCCWNVDAIDLGVSKLRLVSAATVEFFSEIWADMSTFRQTHALASAKGRVLGSGSPSPLALHAIGLTSTASICILVSPYDTDHLPL